MGGGVVRWLRPDFQNPQGKAPATQIGMAEVAAENENEAAEGAASTVAAWPKRLAE
jgi:hypothetical protein